MLPDILKNSNLSLTLSPSDLASDETLLAIPDPNFRKVRTILFVTADQCRVKHG